MKILEKYSILLICITFVQLISGCEKYLDIKSDNRLVTPNSLESFQQLLDEANTMNYNTNSYGEASADDYFITDDTYLSLYVEARNKYIWQNFVYNYDNDWARAYIPVYTSNVVLDNINKVERTTRNYSEWDNIYGSALFYRAHSYLNTVWTYSKAYNVETAKDDLGIVLRVNSDLNVRSFRSTVEECYSRILIDLKQASEKLPSKPFHVLRPSKGAAFGLLARTYLTMGNYEEAFAYADSVIQLSPELLDYRDIGIPSSPTENPFKRFNKETIFYSQMLGYSPTLSLGYVDTILFELYSDDDLRKFLFFGEADNGYHQFRGAYSENTYLQFSGITSAEMYLIKAECEIRLNRINDGIKTINNLIEKRYRSDSNKLKGNLGKESLLEAVLLERRKELFFRGLRWSDIKRLNREGANIILKRVVEGKVFELQPNDNRFALPLPDDVLKSTGIQQNPK